METVLTIKVKQSVTGKLCASVEHGNYTDDNLFTNLTDTLEEIIESHNDSL